MSAAAKPGRDPAATRARLVEAVLAELDEKGYRAIRVADVARRAGRTSGAIYSTFATKHDLLVAALRKRCPAAIPLRLEAASAPRPDPLLDAALDVLDDKGYPATRVSDVAKRAGMTAREITERYPSKHHLLVAAMIACDPEAFQAAIDRATGQAAPIRDAPTAERLIDAALATLDARGYDSAAVGEIARRAGLTTGAIYDHFGSKQALLHAALRQRSDAQFRSTLDVAAETAAAGGDIEHVLGTILTTRATDQHRAMLQVLATTNRDEHVRAELETLLAHRRHELSTLLQAAQHAGQLTPHVSTDALAHLVQLLALGNVVGQAIGIPSTDSPELTDTLVMLGRGVRTGAAP